MKLLITMQVVGGKGGLSNRLVSYFISHPSPLTALPVLLLSTTFIESLGDRRHPMGNQVGKGANRMAIAGPITSPSLLSDLSQR